MVKNKLKYLIPVIIFIALVFRLEVSSFRLGYEMSFLYVSVILFSIFLISKNHVYQGLFLILCCFASYYPICSLTSIQSLRIVSIGMLLYYILVELKLDHEIIYNTLCAACLVHISFLIMQSLRIEPYQIYGMNTNLSHTGLTANPNEASAMIALCAPCFFRKKWLRLIPVLVIGLLIAGSFSGFLAVILIGVSLFLMTFDLNLRSILICSGSLVLISFVLITMLSPDFSGRLAIWTGAIKFYFKENILTGFGLGHWEYISKKYLIDINSLQYFDRAHNTVLQTWFELGMGFLVLLFLYAKKLMSQVKGNKILIFSLISIFIVCNINSAFRINALNGLIIILWLSLIENHKEVKV